MISFVTWLWSSSGRDFRAEHVNVLRNMIERNYGGAHRLICLTDEPDGLDPRVEAMPMPETGFEALLSPVQKLHRHKRFPSCYRRLWVFSDGARCLGERLVCIDIDVVIADDITPIVEREGSFVGWSEPRFDWNKVAGGIYMLTTGAHTEVWEDFDPEESPDLAAAAGFNGSDQAWMSYKLFPLEHSWSSEDGLVKINWTQKHQRTVDARMVFTNGHRPPWLVQTKKDYPWVMDHWR